MTQSDPHSNGTSFFGDESCPEHDRSNPQPRLRKSRKKRSFEKSHLEKIQKNTPLSNRLPYATFKSPLTPVKCFD
jgi:hypothetical protein